MEYVKDLKEVEMMYYEQGYEALSKALKSERASLHPDKNGNKFDSDESEARYHFISSALSHLDELEAKSRQLVPMSEVTKLVEVMSKSIALQNSPTSKDIENTSRQNIRFELNRKYKGKKIGSGIVAGFLGFMITQAPNFEKNPVLKPFIGEPVFLHIMLIIGLCSAAMFFWLWFREGKEESFATYMLSEAPLRDIFEFLKDNKGDTITSYDIYQAVWYRTGGQHHYFLASDLFSTRLCASTIDQIVEVQTQRLIERKAIEIIDTPSVDRQYRVLA
ncbi:TPA: hypothetical protein RG687_001018 [Vibrio parahaemolyticus]|nr:hypothetical protein [Vibrio parahaemolyticus]